MEGGRRGRKGVWVYEERKEMKEGEKGREGGCGSGVLGEPLTFQLHAVHSTLSTACPVDDVCCWVQGYRGDALVGPAHWGDSVCSAAGDVQ